MQILLATGEDNGMFDRYYEHYEQRVQGTYDPQLTIDVLMEKKALLIDVFDTFIPAPRTEDEYITFSSYGALAYTLTQQPRDGFSDFLSFFGEKRLGIHSDAFSQLEFVRLSLHWKFKDAHYFGEAYLRDKDFLTGSSHRKKRFNRMIDEMGVAREDSLVIGDGYSDLAPAVLYDVDLLLVPNFKNDPMFDYRSLLPSR